MPDIAVAHALPSLKNAFDPNASVFVSANAGSGKTRLLTNRVLRLLLQGVAPSRILCLTFTNAASAEMATRILDELGAWVMADDARLANALGGLLSASPSSEMLERARGLFALTLEAPEGVRIQTIHGFCQSLLRRFPLEAGISPHFTVIDERTQQELLLDARLRLFSRAAMPGGRTADAPLQAALSGIAQAVGESGFQELVGEIIRHKRRFISLLHRPGGMQAALDAIWRTAGLARHATEDALVDAHFAYDDSQRAKLREAAGLLLASGGINDGKTGQALADWLDAEEKNVSRAQRYCRAFLTKEGKPCAQKTLYSKKTLTQEEHVDCLFAEQLRIVGFYEACKTLKVARHSEYLLHTAQEMLAIYDRLKQTRALMDYDDLIVTASELLQRPHIAPWVLFKLDGGIDHILVDEAQDTSPEQWAIIDALTEDFFSGDSRSQAARSLFVVGDEKQSIYSFQGADPAMLSRMQRHFERRIRDAALPVHSMELTHSFRSTPEVLAAVDAVFAPPAARAGLTSSGQAFSHTATRGQAGLVELWPLVLPREEDALSHGTLLARRMADTIKDWLERGEMLPSRGRAVLPGDIMILVRRRTPFVDKLVRALKRRGVPVAGVDRMRLSDNLAVQDLMALGACLLLPEDDLMLAALLKSPMFGLDEDALFTLAWERGEASIWERLRQQANEPPFADAFALLSELRSRTDFLSPYELYAHALETLGGRRRITGRMGEEYNDPLDEFLGQALLYEHSHTPSLQGFLHWLSKSESQIKRDMEQAHDALRIMTVHGAKGLQAPVVILPDTTQLPTLQDMLLWHEGLPLWPASSRHDDARCRQLRGEQRQLMLAEYRRLLYVALTRAEDRLYVCGSASRETLDEQCWYALVKSGIAPLAQAFDAGWGEGLRLGTVPLAVVNAKTEPEALLEADRGEWGFLLRPPPAEPLPPHPLVPSHQGDDAPATHSPLAQAGQYQRGTFIHKLLQYLPGRPEAERAALTRMLASLHGGELSNTALQQAAQEAVRIMEDPAFAFLFDSDALAEVPVTGCVDMGGKTVTVSGRLDRLKVTADEAWIVDYKTGRLPPSAPGAIPPAYLRQLRLYRLLLKQIYPQKAVRCAILWTAAPKLTIIDDSILL